MGGAYSCTILELFEIFLTYVEMTLAKRQIWIFPLYIGTAVSVLNSLIKTAPYAGYNVFAAGGGGLSCALDRLQRIEINGGTTMTRM